ncbi:hypothetical protein RRG08_014561 [Elysia crispata]|uniref:Uncharacterized protein n=1 Tax=Elysia crispata TaxID=231223 RepID=A0AAE1E4F7_9GAST|nr:hypothetical protein RRG08_014561 [Elysia crispata]
MESGGKRTTLMLKSGEIAWDHPKVRIRRHYFGAGHGKSLCDSVGGTIKNCALRAVARLPSRVPKVL